ncbi:MAG TPA: hypothetical protein VKX16_17050 [Chloroflexota bacterium]|nr:hypothetical protein [Chloroflexota bacterium]
MVHLKRLILVGVIVAAVAAAFSLGCQRRAEADPGTPSAPATPTAASIQLQPAATLPGSAVEVSGTGFQALEAVLIGYRAQTTYGQTVLVQAAATAGPDGAFAGAMLAVPPYIASGSYQVTATGQLSGIVADSPFTVASTTLPPTTTSTPLPASTPTTTTVVLPSVTATHTPKPTPTRTRTTAPKPYVLAYRYAYPAYHTVRLGTWNRVIVQANHRQRLDVQMSVVFPSGKRLDYAGRTDRRGHWEKKFPVPKSAWDRYSNTADAVVRLLHGLTTKLADVQFTVVR